jgi:hypothetical protein
VSGWRRRGTGRSALVEGCERDRRCADLDDVARAEEVRSGRGVAARCDMQHAGCDMQYACCMSMQRAMRHAR